MNEVVVLYPALDRAIRSGALLDAAPDAGKGAPGRLVRVWSESAGEDLALGVGPTLPDALHAAEQDLLSADPVGTQVSRCSCWVCAMNDRVPVVAGAPAAASVLDGHILALWQFTVRSDGARFALVTEWSRQADRIGSAARQQIHAEGVPSRWRHGEYVWEFVPFKGRTSGKPMMRVRSVSSPPGSKFPYPRERRRVEVEADSLGAVLAAAEGPLAVALGEDEEWLGRTHRCT
jgi:hypothetical protein